MKRLTTVSLGLFSLLLAGCELRQAMFDQPKYQPFQASSFFADGMSARPPVAGTVAWGELPALMPLPPEVTPELQARGRERYTIFCLPCHDSQGLGRGTVVEKGFKQPPVLHERRLREMPDGQLYQVIKNGQGMMDGMAGQIPDADRWAVVAYLRVLQGEAAALAAAPVERSAP